ncbi:MAG: 16S rRNA (guanine(966)-N(2))-methyltransferase RsmD [Lysobacteraceae bacterium]
MNRNSQRNNAAAPGQVRIIGGALRGSKLPVLVRDGLRPSSDRVRETLFNWLQPVVPGARCLDLFAGSGALGFEAASRGAREVVMIERDRGLARSLVSTAGRLKTDSVRVVEADALRWLQSPPADPAQRFDLAFLDPPFAADLWNAVVERLDGWLVDEAWLYLESARDGGAQPGAGWRLHRSGQTRDVEYSLWQRLSGSDASG